MSSHFPDHDFWRGKRVLVTGHTGFKGSWLTIWLHQMGARTTGISLPPESNPNLFDLAKVKELGESHFCDIRDFFNFQKLVQSAEPEIIFHMAAQPLVRESYKDPIGTYSTNVMGTVNILEIMRTLPKLKAAVMVTTDKTYRMNSENKPFSEDDALGGHDPYSASKAASEIIIASYRDSYLRDLGVAVASARAGNVIGGGDWSRDRLIPEVIQAWQENKVAEIRSPHSVRPWQHVLEALSGYLLLAHKIYQNPQLASAYNFGPMTSSTSTVQDVIEKARKHYPGSNVHYSDINSGPHESQWLSLEITKSEEILGFNPQLSLDEAIEKTIKWYESQITGAQARDLTVKDILNYLPSERIEA